MLPIDLDLHIFLLMLSILEMNVPMCSVNIYFVVSI